MSENRNSGAAAPNGAATGGDDLRATITGALADSLAPDPGGAAGGAAGGDAGDEPQRRPFRRGGAARAAATPGPAEPPAVQPTEPPAGGEPGGDRPAAETPPGPAAPPPVQPTEPPPGPPQEPPAAAGREGEAPQHWAATDREEFNALPEAARAPFLRMYKRMEGGFQPRLQRGAQLERDYGELDRTVFTAPQRELISRNGQTTTAIITSWANIERALDRGTNPNNPALRNQILARMIHNYGADPVEIAQALHQLRGFPAQHGGDQPPGNGAGNGAGAPPSAAGNGALPTGLEQRLVALETGHTQREELERQARHGAIERQIAEFANAKDADGGLVHPFFAEVEQDMAGLAQLDRAQGQTPVMQDLYDRAVWARPSTREKLLASQHDAEAKRAADERKAKAEAAKRAAVSVSGAPGPGQAPQSTPDRSLRDEIRAQVGAGSGTR
jgi:hypothetical protein